LILAVRTDSVQKRGKQVTKKSCVKFARRFGS